MWRKFRLRFRALLDREAIRREFDLHLDELARELTEQGMSETEAKAEARRRFGNSALIDEQSHSLFAIPFLEQVLADLRFAQRSQRRTPSVGIVSVLSIGLAIGVNTTVFSLMEEIFLSQPTTRAAEQLVSIRLHGSSHASLPNLRDLHTSGSVEAVAGYDIEKTVNWRDGGRVVQTPVMLVSENYFDLVETRPFLGRTFRASEAVAERNPRLVLITHRMWKRNFPAEMGIVGRSMVLNGHPYTILGVLPEHFRPPTFFNVQPDIYVPMSLELNPSCLNRRSHNLMLIGRMKPGQRMEEARTALLTVAQRLEQSHPRDNERLGRGIRVVGAGGFAQYQDPDAAPLVGFAGVLLVAVFVVLWIACINVAGILIARASARRREIATRLAIGAGRRRLVQQLLTEAFLLCTCGALLGLGIHSFFAGLFNRLSLPLPVPVVFRIEVGGSLLLYTAALTCAATLLAGLLPALEATRTGLTSGLKLEEPQYGSRRFTLRNLLVTGQVAVTVVMLSVALLFTRSLIQAHALQPGFDLEHTVWARVNLVSGRYSKEQVNQFTAQALQSTAATPGVRSAALAAEVPLNNFLRIRTPIHTRHGKVRSEYFSNTVSPGYFETMSIPILAGRTFTQTHRQGAPRTVILGEALAKKLFGNEPATGETIWFGDEKKGPGVEIVGVVANSKHMTMGESQANAVYDSIGYWPLTNTEIHILVRAAQDAASVVAAVQKELGALDNSAAVDVAPLRTRLAFAYLPSQIGAVLVGSLGALGLLLALIGIYGALGFAVSRKRSEIGIRMALGATHRDVLRAVLGPTLGFLSAGLCVGIGIAIAAAQPLVMFLADGIRPADPLTYFSVALVCLVSGVVAAILPALRATSIDPSNTLRVE